MALLDYLKSVSKSPLNQEVASLPSKPKTVGFEPLNAQAQAIRDMAKTAAPKPAANPASTSVKPMLSTQPKPSTPIPTPTQTQSFGGALSPSDPAAIGGSVMKPPTQQNIPTPPQPPSSNPAQEQLKALQKSYLSTFELTPEEKATQAQLDAISARQANLQANERAGEANVMDQSIAMPFISGQTSSLQRQLAALQGQEASQAVPLQAKLASYQAAREAAQRRGEAEVGFTQAEINQQRQDEKDKKSASKPIEVGGVLVDPLTFKPVYQPEQKPIELSPGNTIFDPVTGQPLYTAPTTKSLSGGSSTGGGGSPIDPSNISATAKSVYENPGLINNFTPTVKGQILNELSRAGMDVSRFGLSDVSGGQRELVSKFDDIVREANNAQGLVTSINTGPLAGRLGSIAQVFGQASPEFTAYKSAISNMNSILLNLRSGAAVSPSEYERIKGFIPMINEDEKTAMQKIPLFYDAINEAKNNFINRATQSTYDLAKSASSSNPQGATSGVTPGGISFTVIP